MWTNLKRASATILAGVALLSLAAPQAHGQFFRPVAPGMNLPPAMANPFTPLAAAAARAPWMPGLAGAAALPYGGMAMYPPGMNSNPYGTSAPMIIGMPSGGGSSSNVYGSAGLVDPNNPYSSALAATNSPSGSNSYLPYASDPYSGYLQGSASVIGAQGKLILDQERARLLREMVNQARYETKKRKIEYENWERDNKWTFTKEQKRIYQNTLDRIRTNASTGEIESGKAMNVVLKDLGKVQAKDVNTMTLDEDALKRINVTNKDGVGNLGILRNDGQLTWPAALSDLVTEKERTEVEELTQGLYRLGLEGNLKPNLVRDLRVHVDHMQELLRSKVSEIPSGQFLEARRFLNELQSATTALAVPGLAPAYAAYLRFIHGGKTAKEVADYLISHGLFIAPANPGDEGIYQLLHTALANYDIAASAQVASAH